MSVALLKALTNAQDAGVVGESSKVRLVERQTQSRHFFLSAAYTFSNFIFKDKTKSKSDSRSFADVQARAGAAQSIC